MQNLKLDGRTIAIGLFLIVAAVIFLPRLLGNNNNDSITERDEPLEDDVSPRDTTVNTEDGIELGQTVAAATVDRDGCPTNTTTTFDTNEDRIYVVAQDSDVTEGTEVFVRFYLEGDVYEESDAIVADADYEDTCISFTLEPDDANALRAGDYEAEFIVNGNPANTVQFSVE